MKKHKVLLVEDNKLSSELGSSFLEETGYECRVAGNGAEALHLLRSSTFDLVLMDVEMPVMDGLTAARAIRSELGSDIPVIALSGHVSEEEKKKSIAAGMNDYVVKPFRKETLCAAIAKQLGQEAAFTPAEEPFSPAPATGSVTNLSYLRSIAKDNDRFFTSMIRIFTEQVPNDLEELEKALRICDYETIRMIAHKVKTSVVFVGLDVHVHSQLAEMEMLGDKKKGILRIADLFDHVRKTCDAACDELVPFLNGKKPKSNC